VFLREDRRTGGDPADERQRELSEPLQRQRELLVARLVDGAKRFALQPDAARGAADQLDDALAGQCLQMLLGRVGGLEAQFCRDFGARGGAPVRAMALWIRSRICCWRAVSLGVSIMAATPARRSLGRYWLNIQSLYF
jgi:hypothetical protein